MDLSFVIYVLMAVLVVYALFSKDATGILPLMRASGQLKRAAKRLENWEEAREVRGMILGGIGLDDDADIGLFSGGVLRERMERYCVDVRRMALSAESKCQCDIADYYDDELLEQIGNTPFVEHATSGLTGLGILGTFIGMTQGLGGFNADTSKAALESISTLLGGMEYAFLTSIFGIMLSLALGTVFRICRNGAEENLDRFVRIFHTRVLSDQHEAGFNQVLKHLGSIEKQMTTRPDENVQMLQAVADAFITELADRLEIQTQGIRDAMSGISQQQQMYAAAVTELNGSIRAAAGQIASVGDSFAVITAQSEVLTKQIDAAAAAMRSGMEQIKGMIDADSAILEKQLNLSTQLSESAEELTSLSGAVNEQVRNTAGVVQQLAKFTATAVDETASGCNKLVEDHYAELKQRMEMLLNVAAQQNDQIRQEGVRQLEQVREGGSECFGQIRQENDQLIENIRVQGAQTLDGLRTASERIIRDMPQTVAVRRELDELIRQNEQLIENQVQIMNNINQRNRMVARLQRLWRNEQ